MMLEFHPLANIFPLIEGSEFDSLVEDIKANGVRDQIVLLDGQILDGRNRYRAALLGDAVPVDGSGERFRRFDPEAEGDPVDFVLSKNLARRHLNETQRASAAAKLADMPRHRPGDKCANLRTSQTETAGQFKVSRRLVTSAKAVQDKGTEALNRAMDRGKLPASAAAKATSLPADQQDEIAKKAEAGQANVVRTVIKQAVRNEREKTLGQKQRALPDKKYGAILMDPEWSFKPYSAQTGMDRAADNHYPTSDMRLLLLREIPKISAKDCMCAMWVTDLAQGIRLLEAYGFQFKSYFVWVKDIVPLAGVPGGFETVGPAGTGYWNRDRDELLLIGTRGDFPAPAPGTQGESVWFAARGKHSAKPPNAHLWIEQHWPNLPKIELNARAARKGWDVWGNEAPPAEVEDENQDRFEQEFNQDQIPQSATQAAAIADGKPNAEEAAPGAFPIGDGEAEENHPAPEPVGQTSDTGVTAGETAPSKPAPMEIPEFLRRPLPGSDAP